MEFAHLEKTSLLDYPGRVASVLFTIGCNFRCPFCHNRMLVIPEEYPAHRLDEDTVLSILIKRKKYIDSVAITGGEPTLHHDFVEFLGRLKENGFSVKLDTNGTNPRMLDQIIREGLVDYLALDIKAPKERYSEVVGVTVTPEMMNNIEESFRLTINSGLPYEFKTTVVPTLHTVDDIEEIGRWLKELGAEHYVIQMFRPVKGSLVDRRFESIAPFKDSEVNIFYMTAKKWVKDVVLRQY